MLRSLYLTSSIKSLTLQSQPRIFLSTSTTASSNQDEGIFSRIKSSITAKQKQNLSDQYSKQLLEMAQSSSWTLDSFHSQLKSSTSGWRSMIPGMKNSDAMKMVQKTQRIMESTMEVFGTRDVTLIDLKEKMGKKEKLQICLKSESTLQEINATIQQFEAMDLMHRILRYRLENNIPLPTDEEGAKKMLASDSKNVLSPKEVKEIQKARMKRALR